MKKISKEKIKGRSEDGMVYILSGGVPAQLIENYNLSPQQIVVVEKFIKENHDYFLLGEVINGTLWGIGLEAPLRR